MASTSVLRRPGWWRSRGVVAMLWLPLAAVFLALVSLRRQAFRRGWLSSHKLPVPVVIVGNIAVGGSGKTPLVIWLAKAFQRRGLHPGILSRGYGGTALTATPVTAQSSPSEVGDEPILLSRRTGCPLWVGRDRTQAGQALLAAHPEIDILITDDGLQHYALRRDAEIIVLNEAILGNLWPMPAGPLREPPSRLSFATLLICNGPISERLQANLPPLPCASMQLEPERFYRLTDPAVTCDAKAFQRIRVHALAGIGHPQRFFETLRMLGLELASTRALPDHYAFQNGDLSVPDGEVLLLTEKDAVKCPTSVSDNVWVLPVEARIDDAVLDGLLEHLHGS